MAFPLVAQGQGTKIAFASGFTAEFTELNVDGQEFSAVETTKLSSTGAQEFIQSALYNPKGISGKVHFNPDATFALGGTASTDTITIYYPPVGTATGDTQRSRISSSGFYLSLSHVIPLSGKLMEGDLKIQLSGVISRTATS